MTNAFRLEPPTFFRACHLHETLPVKVILGIFLAILLHVVFGWQWSIVAGAVVGWWIIRKGWLFGALTVGCAWSILVAYNYVVAPESFGRLTSTLSGFVPGAPAWSIPVATILIGTLLGAVGGFLGQAVVPLGTRGEA